LSVSCPDRFTPGEAAPGKNWMGPRVSLDEVAKKENPFSAPIGK